jgi:ribosomal protein S3AE
MLSVISERRSSLTILDLLYSPASTHETSTNLVGDQQNCLLTRGVLQQVIEHLVGSVVVQSRQGIIQKHDITTKVSSTGQVQALALTTRQVDTTQASLAHVTLGQDLQVQLQTTVMIG